MHNRVRTCFFLTTCAFLSLVFYFLTFSQTARAEMYDEVSIETSSGVVTLRTYFTSDDPNVNRTDRFLDFGVTNISKIEAESDYAISKERAAELAWLAWLVEPNNSHLIGENMYFDVPWQGSDYWPIPDVYRYDSGIQELILDPEARERAYFEVLYTSILKRDYLYRFGKDWHGPEIHQIIEKGIRELYPTLSAKSTNELLEKLLTDVYDDTLPDFTSDSFGIASHLLTIASIIPKAPADLSMISGIINGLSALRGIGINAKTEAAYESFQSIMYQAILASQMVRFFDENILPFVNDSALNSAVENLRFFAKGDTLLKQMDAWNTGLDLTLDTTMMLVGVTQAVAQAVGAHATAVGNTALATSLSHIAFYCGVTGAIIYGTYQIIDASSYAFRMTSDDLYFRQVCAARLAWLCRTRNTVWTSAEGHYEYAKVAELIEATIIYEDLFASLTVLHDDHDFKDVMSYWLSDFLASGAPVDDYFEWAWGPDEKSGQLNAYAINIYQTFAREHWINEFTPFVNLICPEPSIEIFAPASAENIFQGGEIHVSWASNNIIGTTLKIELIGEGSYILDAAAPLDGTENYAVPVSAAPGTYRIRISDNNDPAIFTESQALQIVEVVACNKDICLLFPSGSETITPGETYRISWSYTLGSDDTYVNIILLKNGETERWIASDIPMNQCYYDWNVSVTLFEPDSDYQVKIYNKNYAGTPEDVSGYFTISNPPEIIVNNPAVEDEVHEPGTKMVINWTTTGSIGQYVKIWANSLDSDIWEDIDIAETTENTGKYTWTIPNSAFGKYEICIRSINLFYVNGTSLGNIFILEPPEKITNLLPLYGASSLPLDTTISWSIGENTDSCEVYLGTDVDNLVHMGSLTEPLFAPGNLEYDSIYYWRIDAKNAGGTQGGAVWFFTTEKSPEISVSSVSINLGVNDINEIFETSLSLKNTGGGLLTGSVSESITWLNMTGETSFSLAEGEETVLQFQGNFPDNAGAINELIAINSNGGNKEIGVTGFAQYIERWTLEDSPFNAIGFVVPEEMHLILEPGIQVEGDWTESFVYGKLEAIGTPSQPINFLNVSITQRSASAQHSSVILNNCHIQGGNFYWGGRDLTLQDNYLNEMGYFSIQPNGASETSILIDRNIFLNVGIFQFTNFNLGLTAFEIKNNIFYSPNPYAWLKSTFSVTPLIDFKYNSFLTTEPEIFLLNAYYASNGDLIADQNFWGTTDSGIIDAMIYDGNDNNSDAVVIYEPFLSGPHENTPEYYIPELSDSDNDGLKDSFESNLGIDPNNRDTDNDGIQDGTELGLILSDVGFDTDLNIFEPDQDTTSHTDPFDADTDDDGIPDGVEDTNHNGLVDEGETDPCNSDTDSDGIQDGTELGYTLDGLGTDTDLDSFQPDLDPSTHSNPLLEDSDGDGIFDGDEDRDHNGRVDAGEGDPNKKQAVALPFIPLLLLDD